MYNPQNMHECEIEKKRNPHGIIDTLMTIVGGVGSVSSIPQIIKIWQTHTVAGISLTTELVALFTVVVWFVYGRYIKNIPLTITSGLSTIVIGIVVLQMFWYA